MVMTGYPLTASPLDDSTSGSLRETFRVNEVGWNYTDWNRSKDTPHYTTLKITVLTVSLESGYFGGEKAYIEQNNVSVFMRVYSSKRQ